MEDDKDNDKNHEKKDNTTKKKKKNNMSIDCKFNLKVHSSNKIVR